LLQPTSETAPNQEASQKHKEQSFSQISRKKRRSLTEANLSKPVEAKVQTRVTFLFSERNA